MTSTDGSTSTHECDSIPCMCQQLQKFPPLQGVHLENLVYIALFIVTGMHIHIHTSTIKSPRRAHALGAWRYNVRPQRAQMQCWRLYARLWRAADGSQSLELRSSRQGAGWPATAHLGRRAAQHGHSHGAAHCYGVHPALSARQFRNNVHTRMLLTPQPSASSNASPLPQLLGSGSSVSRAGSMVLRGVHMKSVTAITGR